MDFNLKETIYIDGEEHVLKITDMSDGKVTGFEFDNEKFRNEKMINKDAFNDDEQLKDKSKELFKKYDEALNSTEANKDGKRRHRKKWNEKEDQAIIDNRHLSLEEMVKKKIVPDRTESAIRDRIHQLIKKKKLTVKTRETTRNLNFKHRVLETKTIAIYEQCFNDLVLNVGNMDSFNNGDVFRIIRAWYKSVRGKDLTKLSISTQNDYSHDYIEYGLEQGVFERTQYNTYRYVECIEKKDAEDVVEEGKKILDEVEKKEILVSKKQSLVEEKPNITFVDNHGKQVEDDKLKGTYKAHVDKRIKEMREREKSQRNKTHI